jgi:quinol monooxygenase YgiN
MKITNTPKHVIELKRKLYIALLQLECSGVNQDNGNLLYALSKDQDVQNIIERNKNESRKTA